MEVGQETRGRRPYRMRARAAAAAATGERILDSASELFWEHPSDEVALDEVARRADVSVRTVIRRFGGKRDLLAAAWQRGAERVRHQRDQAPVGDVPGAVRTLVDHYEELGERVVMLLAEERRKPELRPMVEAGRREHAAWCARVFAPALARAHGVARERRLAQLVAVCDVYTWKLLRLDRGLSRRQTERALVELLEPITKEA
jgi:AcrR family transcriptional regulator